jgi:hypothetical protein
LHRNLISVSYLERFHLYITLALHLKRGIFAL